jgi:hypothetical protein
MTDAELDNARAAEAFRLWGEGHGVECSDCGSIAALAAKLARTGWEPVADTLLLEAREICATAHHNNGGYTKWVELCRAGEHDDSPEVLATLAALKRGIEIGKDQTP